MNKKERKNIILGIIIVIIIVAIINLEGTRITPSQGSKLQIKQGNYPKAPELTGISGYINTNNKTIRISDFKGNVVLVDFWTYTCINCIRTIPFLNDWYNKYHDKGLVIIGVHTPEFDFEKDINNVGNAVAKYRIKYYVVQDNDYGTWSAFGNSYWPHKYLIDKDGYVVYDHIGEGGYDTTEKKIQQLLSEAGHNVSNMPISTIPDLTPQYETTSEIYAGYNFAIPRGEDIGNKEGLQLGQTISYVLPDTINQNKIYLEGKWKSNPDNIQSEGNSSIILDFTAKSANIVVGPGSENTKMYVFIGNKYVSKEQAGNDVQFEGDKAFVMVKEPRLYNVVSGEYGNYELKLSVDSEAFNFNSFTFG